MDPQTCPSFGGRGSVAMAYFVMLCWRLRESSSLPPAGNSKTGVARSARRRAVGFAASLFQRVGQADG